MMDVNDVLIGLTFLANTVENDTDSEIFSYAIDSIKKLEAIKQIIKELPYGGQTTVYRIEDVINYEE